MIFSNKLIWLMAFALLIMILPSGTVQAVQEAADVTAAVVVDIPISFKLDPRLTLSMYMGDRWISPSTYTGTVGQDTVEARAEALDSDGKPLGTNPEWRPEDPGMVTVSPSRGREVKISVHHAGESVLKVASLGFSKKLFIKATGDGKTLQLEITPEQVPAAVQE